MKKFLESLRIPTSLWSLHTPKQLTFSVLNSSLANLPHCSLFGLIWINKSWICSFVLLCTLINFNWRLGNPHHSILLAAMLLFCCFVCFRSQFGPCHDVENSCCWNIHPPTFQPDHWSFSRGAVWLLLAGLLSYCCRSWRQRRAHAACCCCCRRCPT